VFVTDFYMSLYWFDPRLDGTSFDPNVNWIPGVDFQNIQGAVEEVEDSTLAYTWNNNITQYIPNPPPGTENLAWVEFDQRYIGSFFTPLDLKNFPFDRQQALLIIESSSWNSRSLQFLPVSTSFNSRLLPTDLEVTEWDVTGTGLNIYERDYPVYHDVYASFQVAIDLDRKPQFYMYKIVAGTILLVYMAICLFMLEAESSARIIGALTLFLAIITFEFVAAQSVPKVAYQTKIDLFMDSSFFCVFLTCFAHAFNYYFRKEEVEEEEEHGHAHGGHGGGHGHGEHEKEKSGHGEHEKEKSVELTPHKPLSVAGATDSAAGSPTHEPKPAEHGHGEHGHSEHGHGEHGHGEHGHAHGEHGHGDTHGAEAKKSEPMETSQSEAEAPRGSHSGGSGKSFGLVAYWHELHFSKKLDCAFVFIFSVGYAITIGVILQH